MTNDAEWVEDVKRWVAGTNAPTVQTSDVESTDMMALGYEAAHPALQARHWPAPVATGFCDAI